MVIEPRASVVVDGQEAVTLVPNRPGEHARVVHMHALSRLVVVASEMGVSMFMWVGLDLCSQAVGAFTVSGGHSGEVHFVLGSNAKGSKAEMAQFGMPSFPRVCSKLKLAAGSGVSHPPHWWLDSQPVCWSRFAQVVMVGPRSKCDCAFEVASNILCPKVWAGSIHRLNNASSPARGSIVLDMYVREALREFFLMNDFSRNFNSTSPL